MDCDRVSIDIGDHQMWEQRMARLRALKLVNQAEIECPFNPLLLATAKEGDIDKFIEALEKYSAKERVSLSDIINIKGPSGNSLFHIAAGNEKADILQALLEVFQKEQLYLKVNNQRDTALHIAARAGRIRTAEFLLGYCDIMDMKNDMGNTALHEAVKNRHSELISLLLSKNRTLVYQKNKESKSPLYLAVEMGDLKNLMLLMEPVDGHEVLPSRIEGMSPAHGAVIHRRKEMLKKMSKQKKELFYLRDAGGGTPLHLAASMNYVHEVEFLVKEFTSSAFDDDKKGYLPIHVACKMGHLEIIEKLLQLWTNPDELLTLTEGQNILHIAAKHGMTSVVKYILGDPKFEKLINAKDKEGNSPLHVATLQWQPKVLLSLTRDNRVNLNLVNNDNLTAHDIVDERLTKIDAPLRQSLTRTILLSAGAFGSKEKAICRPEGLGPERDVEPPNLDKLKDHADTRMVVATLVAAMTFAAGFSVPGGYNGSEPDAGIATLLSKPMYDVFVICNTVAMYSSIIAVVILLWSQINDSNGVHHALRMARLPLLIALASMSVAFMAGVYVTISKRTWMAIVVLIIGTTALFLILCLYIALFVRLRYTSRLGQLFADYIIKVGISISISVTEGKSTGPARSEEPVPRGCPEGKATGPARPEEPVPMGCPDSVQWPTSVCLLLASAEGDGKMEIESGDGEMEMESPTSLLMARARGDREMEMESQRR